MVLLGSPAEGDAPTKRTVARVTPPGPAPVPAPAPGAEPVLPVPLVAVGARSNAPSPAGGGASPLPVGWSANIARAKDEMGAWAWDVASAMPRDACVNGNPLVAADDDDVVVVVLVAAVDGGRFSGLANDAARMASSVKLFAKILMRVRCAAGRTTAGTCNEVISRFVMWNRSDGTGSYMAGRHCDGVLASITR